MFASNTGILDIVGNLSNDGAVRAEMGSLIDASGVLTNNTSGSLEGNGEIEASAIFNNGRIAPGASVGALTLDGDTTFGSTSLFDVEIDSTDADALTVLGQLDLDGDLSLTLDAFLPAFADEYTIATADSEILGSFGNVLNGDSLLTQGGEGTFDVHYGAGSIFGSNQIVLSNFTFSAVPEPGSMTVLLTLMASTLLVRRRRA